MRGRLKVPATSANFGAGFDVFGVAVELFNYFEFDTDTEEFVFKSNGKYGNLIKDYSLFYKVFSEFEKLTGKRIPKVKIFQTCNTPVSRGLGSSAAVIAATLTIANVLTGAHLSQAELIKIGVKIEGHADNIIPAFVGGLVVSYYDGYNLDFEVFRDVDFGKLTFLVPNFQLSTELMRKVLPGNISHKDATFNLKNATQFLAKIASGNFRDALKYTLDRLHQKPRIEASEKMKTFVESILTKNPSYWFLSGSGSTVCADIKDFKDIPFLEEVIITEVFKNGLELELF